MEARHIARYLNRLVSVRDELNEAQDYDGKLIDEFEDLDDDFLNSIISIANKYGCAAFSDEFGNGVVTTKEDYNNYKVLDNMSYGDYLMKCLTAVTEDTEMQRLMDLVHDFIVWHINYNEIKSWLDETTNDKMFEIYCETRNYIKAFIKYVSTCEPNVAELLVACGMLVKNYVKDIDKYFLV